MTVVVLPEVAEALRESHSLLIEVRSDDAQLPSAMAALRQAMVRLEGQGYDGEVERPAFVSQPVPLPGTQLLLVDFGSLPDQPVLAVPQLLEQQLRDGGVHHAVVAVARPGRAEALEDLGPAARAYLQAPLATLAAKAPPPPLPLLDVGIRWLRTQRHPYDELSTFVLGVEVPQTEQSQRTVAAAVLSTLPPAVGVTLTASDYTSRLAAAAVVGGYRNTVPMASLTAAGQARTTAQLAQQMHRLRELIRAHASALIWAGIEVEADTRLVFHPGWTHRAPSSAAPAPPRPTVERLADVLVPDAMWYQILSTGHLHRLGGLPAGAVPLDQDRAELTVGEPEQWAPGHPDRDAVRVRGRQLLAGCLVSEQQAFEMTVARARQGRPPMNGYER
jgi:hypothetical protein